MPDTIPHAVSPNAWRGACCEREGCGAWRGGRADAETNCPIRSPSKGVYVARMRAVRALLSFPDGRTQMKPNTTRPWIDGAGHVDPQLAKGLRERAAPAAAPRESGFLDSSAHSLDPLAE
jgi:hypothetical protein